MRTLLFIACWLAIPMLAGGQDQAKLQAYHRINQRILAKFAQYPLVAVGEGDHQSALTHEWLKTLIHEKAFSSRVNNIVVEFGAAKYQPIMDAYTNGETVADSLVKKCWRETSQLLTWNHPVYAAFFRDIRRINTGLPKHKRIRVLLGDPAFEETFGNGRADRDGHAALLVGKEVLARRQTALIIYGTMHLQRYNLTYNFDRRVKPVFLGQWLEAKYPGKTYTIWNKLNTNDSLIVAILEKNRIKPPVMLEVSGSKLGELDFTNFYPYDEARFDTSGKPLDRSQYKKLAMKEGFDGILYLGSWEEASYTAPVPDSVYDDSLYVNEVIRKAASRKDLFSFQLEHMQFQKVKRTAIYQRFMDALRTDDMAAAQRAYQTVLKTYPNFNWPFRAVLIGYSLLETKHLPESVKAFQLAVNQFPNEAFAHEGLGDGYAAAGQTDKARSSYEQALKLSPNPDLKRKRERLRLSK